MPERRRLMVVVGTRGLSFAWWWPQIRIERRADWVVDIGLENRPGEGA